MRTSQLGLFLLLGISIPLHAADSIDTWQYSFDGERSYSSINWSVGGWTSIKAGEPFKTSNRGAWLRAAITIPQKIGGTTTLGLPVGLKVNSDCGGEIYVDGQLQMRYDNDHAGLALLTKSAKPNQRVRIAVRVFRDIGDENKEQRLGEAQYVILSQTRVNKPFRITVDGAKVSGTLPSSYIGLSQGAGMADYNDDTAARFKEIGVKWFRMDNIFTNAVKRDESGRLVYDWTDFDKRLDFMKKIGCEFIACASYMPQALEAFNDADRHARPKSYKEWEELCYLGAKRAIETGHRIRYWEVWNESNAAWFKGMPGEDNLAEYLKLYDATWRGVHRADPDAFIGGPCNASGPWNQSPERGYAINGENYMRGLLNHCQQTGAPLDFITWHEYFQEPKTIREEAEVTRKYMKDYPKAAKGVREFMITEWNYAWWPDWPQDHELGAAWIANSVLRAMLPAGIAKPCFFYAKDGDDNFRGGWGMLMGPNRPKAVYNTAKLFSMMGSKRLTLNCNDNELTGLASTDPKTGRTTILLTNFAERYGVERSVNLSLINLDNRLVGGVQRTWIVDKEHSNAFNNKDRSELERWLDDRRIDANHTTLSLSLPTNSVALVELLPKG